MRFKIYLVFIFFLLSLIVFQTIFRNSNEAKYNIIAKQNNYLVYYDKVSDLNINNLSEYDLVILEPSNISADHLFRLKNTNVIPYGYQSIFEVELYNKEKISLLNEDDYLYIDGVKQFNEKYQCYYGNIKSENYKKVLLNSIEENVLQKGFQGVFFDTLDDMEHFIQEPYREELYLGYIEFFKILKSKYPELSIIQNRAFDLYNFGSAKYLDGLMFEDLKYEKLEEYDEYNKLIDRVISTSEKYNVVVLALSHEDALENYELAKKLNWLYHFNSLENNYMKFEKKIYDIHIK